MFCVSIPQQIVDNTAMGSLEQKRRHTASESAEAKTDLEQKNLYIPDAKILVVDDTPMNLVVVKGLLKRSQAQLDLVTSGNECLVKTKEKKYDLILMDHMMPKPDGVETLHLIKEDDENINQDTPIVVLTANAIAGMREQYLQEGFVDYLSKPVEVDKLEGVLKRLLV